MLIANTLLQRVDFKFFCGGSAKFQIPLSTEACLHYNSKYPQVSKGWNKESYSTTMCTAPSDQCSAICQMWRQDADKQTISHIRHNVLSVLQKTKICLIFPQLSSILLSSAWFEFSLHCQDVCQKIYWNCAHCCRFFSSFNVQAKIFSCWKPIRRLLS